VATDYPKYVDLTGEEPEVHGTIESFDQAPTKYGEAVVVNVKVEPDGEVRAVWLTQTVLRSAFARLRPDVGERIAITYEGQRDGANGAYHDFKVSCPDRPPFKPDWDALGDEDGDGSELGGEA
jgi:hypothetical protein